jgi:pimeloyl-ACP methyl ester carboxylesterase
MHPDNRQRSGLDAPWEGLVADGSSAYREATKGLCMAQVSNNGVKISYDVAGEGQPLLMLHGWVCDRTWWTEPGYTDDLRRDHLVVNMDLRGFGESDKPHDPSAHSIELMTSDVLAVADAEGIDRFALWGQSYGGWIAWMTAYSVPDRVAALISSGSWDPRPSTYEEWKEFDESWLEAIRGGGMRGLLDLIEEDEGERFPSEYPPWAQAVVLRADPEAALASQSRGAWERGITDLEAFPVPTLLIAGELEDERDEAAVVAGMLPNGDSLRLPGLGHAGAAIASELTLPTARAFLDRWFV